MKKIFLTSFFTVIVVTVIIYNITVIWSDNNQSYLLNLQDVEAMASSEDPRHLTYEPHQEVCPGSNGSEYRIKCYSVTSTSPKSCSDTQCPNCQTNGHNWGAAAAGGAVHCKRCGAQKPTGNNGNPNDVNYCAPAPQKTHDWRYSAGAGRTQCYYCGRAQ